MSKQLGFVLLGLGVVGGAIALSRQASAAKPPQSLPPAEEIEEAEIPEPAIQFPTDEPLPSESEAPAPGGGPGAGSGSVPSEAEELFELLPQVLRDVNLTGNEELAYIGIEPIGPGGLQFYHWVISHSHNDMPIGIFQSVDDPVNNWLAFFIKTNPPGSTKPSHAIGFKESPTMSEAMRQYMHRYIAGWGIQ